MLSFGVGTKALQLHKTPNAYIKFMLKAIYFILRGNEVLKYMLQTRAENLLFVVIAN